MADENDEVKSPLSFAQKLQTQTTESQRLLDQHRTRLMNLIGAPPSLIEYNEHIYLADQKISIDNFNIR